MNDFLSEFVPRLDTIEFDELVTKARGDIPRYAPDWTDHNLHDPGMTMIDLLAWIVDQQVYRTGAVGGRHRAAFAALLGVRPAGPAPARGLVWPARPSRTGSFLAAGSALVCAPHPDLPFVLEHDVFLTPAALTQVRLVVDGTEMPPPSPRADGGSWALGRLGHMAGTVLTLDFDRPLGSPTREAHIPLAVDVVPPPGAPPILDERPFGPVVYAYREDGSSWTGVHVVHDGTNGLSSTGVVVLALPARPGVARGSQLRLTFGNGFFPVPPQIRGASVNVLPIVQREDEPAASFPAPANGQPDHAVELDTVGLVPPVSRPDGSLLEIEIDGEPWTEQRDFSRSGPADPHWVLRSGRVVFGNGVNGRRPQRGAGIAHTALARTAGSAGNLRRDLTWSVPALGADGVAYGRNLRPLTGGSDGTGSADVAGAARDAATRRSAVLTDADLAAAARELPGMAVARAEVVAGFHHRLPGRRVDGVRTLIVVPRQDPQPGPVVVPADFLAEVAARLGPRRVLGERLLVQGPVVVPVELWLTLTVGAGRRHDDAALAVRQALRDRMSVTAWPLGRELSATDVQAIAATVAGVTEVVAVRLATAGQPTGDGPVPVPPDGLVVAGDIHIEPGGRSA